MTVAGYASAARRAAFEDERCLRNRIELENIGAGP